MKHFAKRAPQSAFQFAAKLGRNEPQQKSPVAAGLQERTENVNAILQPKGQRNAAMDIPLRKSEGADWIRVTPDLARHWLTFNTANRKMNMANLKKYQAAMLAGAWNVDGATIKFAYGKLLDGQTRLTAVVETGSTIRSLVAWGLDPEVQAEIDVLGVRTSVNMLQMEGLDDWESKTSGTGLHTVISYEAGRPLFSAAKATNTEIRNYFLEHRTKVEESLRCVKLLPRRPTLIPLSRIFALHYLFAKRDLAAATTFFTRLTTGVDLVANSPIFHLRKRLDVDLIHRKSRGDFELLCMVVKAWNGYRAGRSMKTEGSLRPIEGESFPEIA